MRLEAAGYLGECVGRLAGLVVFAAGGLPGEEVVVEVDVRRRQYVRGRVVEVLTPAPERVAAPCPLYGACGGCSWQHVDYAAELALKAALVADQLSRIGGFGEPPCRPLVAAPSPYRYRNQGRFSLTPDGRLGLTRRRSRAVLPAEDCLLMQEPIAAALAALAAAGPLASSPAAVAHLHQVVIRCGARSGQRLIAPRLASVVGLESGQPAYEEVLLGRRFRVSANAFFQANTLPAPRPLPAGLAAPAGLALPADGLSQADLLAVAVLDRLALTGGETLLDAYAGVGTFALLAAERARRVVAIEESAAAVADARHNVGPEASGAPEGLARRVEFRAGKVESVLPELDERFDAAVLDPSRVGCAPAVLAALLRLRPPRLVYVSCDPATLARDLRLLCQADYDLAEVLPIDMFPRTHHVECVATLVRR